MFEKLFGWTKEEKSTKDKNISNHTQSKILMLGRYSDNNKSVQQLTWWDEATKAFEEKKYMDAYRIFFKYLKDEKINNITIQDTSSEIQFEIYQGSKIIRGTCNEERLHARGNIARMNINNIAVMRKLLNANFTLNYTRYAMDSDRILCVIADCENKGMNASKLYYTLKEVATRCDRQDDILSNEFSTLVSLDTQHIEPYPQDILQKKYDWLQQALKDLFIRIDALDMEKDNGAISYAIMSMVFRIDYFISPEGKTLEYLEKTTQAYFANDQKTYPEKNKIIMDELRKLQLLSFDEFSKDVYPSRSTFSFVNPVGFQTCADSIINSNKNHDWYHKNNFPDTAIQCAEYGFSYCRYFYSLPQIVNELYDVFMNVLHTDFYKTLGLDREFYNTSTKLFDRESILRYVRTVIDQEKAKYPNIDFAIENIKTDSLLNFAISFSEEVSYLNFGK